MRLSLCVDPGRSWPQLLALAQRADAAGWHAVYVCDHFMPNDPAGRPADGPMLECWTVMAALATQTRTARLGSLVLGGTYRHPAVVANMAATLDQVSGGRLVLGVGAGWQVNEHEAYGIPLPAPRERIDRLDEACAVIRSLLDQRRTTLDGAFYSLRDAPCEPKPAGRVPLLVGGAGRRTMGVAARHADAWHAWGSPARFAELNGVLDGLCREAGRRPGDVIRVAGAEVTVLSSPAGGAAAGRGGVRGTAGEILAQLLEFGEAGADEFLVSDDAGVPFERSLAQIDVLTREVLPGLTRERATGSGRCGR